MEKNIKFLFHISDIHIRNNEKFGHIIVFDNTIRIMREKCKELGVEYGEVGVVITGDIFHNKDKYDPQDVQDAFYLFDKLIDIGPVFVIAGNHDGNMRNHDSRMDLIRPIAERYSNHLRYYRESGVYYHANIEFSVMSRVDPVDAEVLTKAGAGAVGNSNMRRVALIHDEIGGAQYDNGTTVAGKIGMDFINNYDYVLAGDIHRRQSFGRRNHAAYAGSLYQQKIDESLEKGFLIWDMSLTETPFTFVWVPHDRCFLQLKMVGGMWEEPMPDHRLVPQRVIKCSVDIVSSGALDVETIRTQIQTMYLTQIDEIVCHNMDNFIVPRVEDVTTVRRNITIDATASSHVREFFGSRNYTLALGDSDLFFE